MSERLKSCTSTVQQGQLLSVQAIGQRAFSEAGNCQTPTGPAHVQQMSISVASPFLCTIKLLEKYLALLILVPVQGSASFYPNILHVFDQPNFS